MVYPDLSALFYLLRLGSSLKSEVCLFSVRWYHWQTNIERKWQNGKSFRDCKILCVNGTNLS